MAEPARIEYKVDNEAVTQQQAIEAGIYSRHLPAAGDREETIELYSHPNLYKVIYPERRPPFAVILQRHAQEYGNIDCEIWSPRRPLPDHTRQFDAWLFARGAELIMHTHCSEDASGRLSQETQYSADGSFIAAYGYHYDGNKLVRVIELDRNGHPIAQQEIG